MKSAENPYNTRIFEDTKGIVTRGFSRPPRYDRFDNPPWEILNIKELMKSAPLSYHIQREMSTGFLKKSEQTFGFHDFGEGAVIVDLDEADLGEVDGFVVAAGTVVVAHEDDLVE